MDFSNPFANDCSRRRLLLRFFLLLGRFTLNAGSSAKLRVNPVAVCSGDSNKLPPIDPPTN